MGILVVSPFWLLWAWMCKCLLQVLSSTPLGVGPDVKFLDPTMPSTVQFRNIFDHSEVVISIQSKGSFRWDSAEMQADTSKFVLTIWLMLGDVKWFVFNLKWFVFNWFSSPVSFFFFFFLQHQASSCAGTTWQRGSGKGKSFVLTTPPSQT